MVLYFSQVSNLRRAPHLMSQHFRPPGVPAKTLERGASRCAHVISGQRGNKAQFSGRAKMQRNVDACRIPGKVVQTEPLHKQAGL